MIIDGMMHLEVNGAFWDGLIDEVIRHYDAAGIDRGVVMATWTPSRESNDRTLAACRRHPDRFVPFGHVRPIDDWENELVRITQEFGWTGLKLHQGELREHTAGSLAAARLIVEKAALLGIRLVKIHLEDYEAVSQLTGDMPEVTWIIPHMGCYTRPAEMQRYCDLARERPNVYLDTSGLASYYDLGRGIQWAGAEKVTFATDGYLYSVLVERAKIDTLRLPTPFRTPLLTDAEYGLIMGGTMRRLLGL